MKKILVILSLFLLNFISAQFEINIEAPYTFNPKEVYLYTLNGSKDILMTKETKKANKWEIKALKPYVGMMKLYFPETNASINLISENKDVKIRFDEKNGKISDIQYLDESNSLMNNIQDIQQKKEYILPALQQIKDYYKGGDEFRKALDDEIFRLSAKTENLNQNNPFIDFYNSNYAKYLDKNDTEKKLTHDEIIKVLSNSSDMLETSSLMRPLLMAFLNIGPSTNLKMDIDQLLSTVNVETPRGQTILSELIEIFDIYEMKDLKEKYLAEAKGLKCSINERLINTITIYKNTEVGAIFPNYIFNKATNTSVKSVFEVKANRKVVIFWASTCSHCEADLPKLIEKYKTMKNQKIEIIAFSLDSEKEAYELKVRSLPWINDTELRGWNSSFSETYNIHATPSYFILDEQNKILAKPNHASDVISYLKLN